MDDGITDAHDYMTICIICPRVAPSPYMKIFVLFGQQIMEKQVQLPTIAPTASRGQQTPRIAFGQRIFSTIWLALTVFVLCYFVKFAGTGTQQHGHLAEDSPSKCYQPPAFFPSYDSDKLNRTYAYLSSPEFRNASIQRLQGAVRIRTESFDDMGDVSEDPRWNVFPQFHDYLRTSYPLTHDNLKVEKVNTHGLLYTWKGSDESLKPTLLTAHQDTVPVPDFTLDSWTHPPFDAVFDGTYIWGRGANDCKNQLTAILETVENLIDAGFEPKRTLLLSFGFDEEVSGPRGAGHLAPFLLDRYGPDSIEVLVDEGLGYAEAFGRGFAMPGVAEKGYVDVDITVRTPGGHSSIPADHTSIGILSELITRLEAQPYDPFLDTRNPYLAFLHCAATHAPEFPPHLRKLLAAHRSPTAVSDTNPAQKSTDRLAQEVARLGGPAVRYLMQTSQAVDLIAGGAKINALPETASATVDHRVNIGDSPAAVRAHLAEIAAVVAEKFNLSLIAYPDTVTPPPSSSSSSSSSSLLLPSTQLTAVTTMTKPATNVIILTARNTTLEVAPITPTDADAPSAYRVLAGTIRAVFGDGPVVAPGLMGGNTDTRHYWALTQQIFRFAPGLVGEIDGARNVHTVDERVSAANHVRAVRWFTIFIRNMDEAKLVG